jgi:hypothetical protein
LAQGDPDASGAPALIEANEALVNWESDGSARSTITDALEGKRCNNFYTYFGAGRGRSNDPTDSD